MHNTPAGCPNAADRQFDRRAAEAAAAPVVSPRTGDGPRGWRGDGRDGAPAGGGTTPCTRGCARERGIRGGGDPMGTEPRSDRDIGAWAPRNRDLDDSTTGSRGPDSLGEPRGSYDTSDWASGIFRKSIETPSGRRPTLPEVSNQRTSRHVNRASASDTGFQKYINPTGAQGLAVPCSKPRHRACLPEPLPPHLSPLPAPSTPSLRPTTLPPHLPPLPPSPTACLGPARMADLRACFCPQGSGGVPGDFSQVSRATWYEHRRLKSGRPSRRARAPAVALPRAAAVASPAAAPPSTEATARTPDDASRATGSSPSAGDGDVGDSGGAAEQPAAAPETLGLVAMAGL